MTLNQSFVWKTYEQASYYITQRQIISINMLNIRRIKIKKFSDICREGMYKCYVRSQESLKTYYKVRFRFM